MPSDAMSSSLKDLTRRYAAAFAARDGAALAALLHDDVVLDDPAAGRIVGKAAVLAFNQGIFDGCRTLDCRVVSVGADQTTTTLEFDLALDGQRFIGIDAMEWRDGRIAAIRAYVNPVPAAPPPKPSLTPVVFVLDVDGVMTDGRYDYTAEGKATKRFGPDDHDALSLLKKHLEIRFVSGDGKGFEISRRRIETDMKFPLDLVSTVRRAEWIAERYPVDRTIYMGDGIFDPLVLKAVGYGIAPADADPGAIAAADYVTRRPGGNRAVAEACLHIMAAFFEPFDVFALTGSNTQVSGTWMV